MVNCERMIRDVLDCLGWPYVSPGGTGKDCSGCGIDCSGLLVRAYKLQGESLYHGSNYIARYELDGEPEALKSAAQLRRGMAVFKWSPTGQPSKYAGDGKGNYHHVGVVTSVNPLNITHASSVAREVKRDTVIKGWTHFGNLKRVEYGPEPWPEEADMAKYKVVAANGSTVNLRRSPSTTADRVAQIAVGSIVEAAPAIDGWMTVSGCGYSGFMLSKFLEPVGEDGDLAQQVRILADEVQLLRDEVRLLAERVQAVEGGVG